MNILGVRIDNFSKKEILARIESFLNEEKFHQIATVNPDFILRAQNDLELKNILNSCDLNVADGVGIWYAFIRNFSFLKSRFAGVDLLGEILKIAHQNKISIYLAINKDGLSSYQEIRTVLKKIYPDLKINGADIIMSSHQLSVISHQMHTITDDRLPMTDCRILFCNFGSPAQEKFLNLQKNGNIRLAMGVGGSFDFLTGKVKRAPKCLRIFGLEWLWRLVFHPSSSRNFLLKRLMTIFKSTVVFPIKILINK